MADPSKLSATDTAHHKQCHKHFTKVGVKCNAQTQKGVLCTRNAKRFLDGCMPVCNQHFYYVVKAGRCQAIEECGHTCLRLAPYHAPFHFCECHDKGTDTLPCHIMRLPTELRLMIFRYLFPDEILEHGRFPRANAVSILKVNRQVYKEASSVLYGETSFCANITPRMVRFLGKTWTRAPHEGSVLRTSGYDLTRTFSGLAASRIKNWVIEIKLGLVLPYPTGLSDDYDLHEDHSLFEGRESVRMFVEMMNGNVQDQTPDDNGVDSLRRKLKIKPDLGEYFKPEPDRTIAAINLVLGPFKEDLQSVHSSELSAASAYDYSHNPHYFTIGIGGTSPTILMHQYESYQRDWQAFFDNRLDLEKSRPGIDSIVTTKELLADRKKKCRTMYLSLRNFVEHLYEKDLKTRSDKMRRPWIETVFEGIERPLHMARVAAENYDEGTLITIQNAIKQRWVEYQRSSQRDSMAVTELISEMRPTQSSGSSLEDEHPAIFQIKRKDEVNKQDNLGNHKWTELKAKQTKWPNPRSSKYTFWEDSEREYCAKSRDAPAKDIRTRLKTPAIVREAEKSRHS